MSKMLKTVSNGKLRYKQQLGLYKNKKIDDNVLTENIKSNPIGWS